jgi:hypothetical protein
MAHEPCNDGWLAGEDEVGVILQSRMGAPDCPFGEMISQKFLPLDLARTPSAAS